MTNPLDHICGIHRYATDPAKAAYAEFHYIDDFVVEEILRDGTIVSIDNPELKHSGYPGLFTHFILVKKNVDTFFVIKILSKKLNVPRNFFFLSGLKDKEALTAQRACVFGIPPERLMMLDLPRNIRIYCPVRELRRVSIGDHWGNRFRIRLRNVNCCVEDVFHEVMQKPILNFFGHQRFGLWKPINHIVGKMIIQGRYYEALMTFLREVNPLFPNRGTFLDLLEEHKYKDALELLPERKFWLERLLLRGLMRRMDPARILCSMPFRLIRLIVEAYQSFLFNLLLSELENPPRKLPLVGYMLDLRHLDNEVAEVLKNILDEEGVSPKDFNIRGAKLEISRGGYRASTVSLKNPELKKEGDSYIISFSLPKGSFATIVLREIVKENIMCLLLGRKRGSSTNYAEVLNKMNDYYTSLISNYFFGFHLQNFAV